MLVAFSSQTIIVKNIVAGDRCVKFHVISKLNNFEWSLVTVYGAKCFLLMKSKDTDP
jgi:hypothetical protein